MPARIGKSCRITAHTGGGRAGMRIVKCDGVIRYQLCCLQCPEQSIQQPVLYRPQLCLQQRMADPAVLFHRKGLAERLL